MVIARRSFWGLFFGTVPARRARDPIMITPPPNLEKHNFASFFFVSGRTGGQEPGKPRNYDAKLIFSNFGGGVILIGSRARWAGTVPNKKNMCPKRMFAKNIYELALKAKCPNASRGRRIGMQVCRSAMHFILNRQMDTKTIVSMLG